MSEANSNSTVETENDYAFAPIPNEGKVNVANHSHGAENLLDHIHTVMIDETGRPVSCTCLGFKYGATTKHLAAVEANQDVIDVADPSCCPNGHEFCVGPDGLFAPDDGGWRCASCFMEADV